MKRSSITMRETDADFRKTSRRLGIALVAFFALFSALNLLSDALGRMLSPLLDEPMKTVVLELLDSVAYALAFLLPLWLLHSITPKDLDVPLSLSPRLPRRLYLLLPAGMAVIYSAAVTNAFLIRSLGLASSPSGGPYFVDGMPLTDGLLLLISSVLIPAFFEELLFRGAVLSQLLPYGKTVAVLGSAVLFGLMHQNAEQLLYTTLAGVVLAGLVIESGSIWASVLLHLFNNLFAALESILYERMSAFLASRVFACLEVCVIGGGLICLCTLLAKNHGQRGKPFWQETMDKPTHPVRDFFTLPMTLFVLLGVAQMIWRIVIFS